MRTQNAPDEIEIREDERLLQLKATGNNVRRVLVRKLVALLKLEVRLEEELLVICAVRRQLAILARNSPSRN